MLVNKKQIDEMVKQIADEYFKDETKCHMVERIATSAASPVQKYKMVQDLTRCVEQTVRFTIENLNQANRNNYE